MLTKKLKYIRIKKTKKIKKKSKRMTGNGIIDWVKRYTTSSSYNNNPLNNEKINNLLKKILSTAQQIDLNVLNPPEKSLGKSKQLVWISNDKKFVYKQQTIPFDKRGLTVNNNNKIIKVDSFTMNLMQQTIMNTIYKFFENNNNKYSCILNSFEHPINTFKNKDNDKIVMKFNKADEIFENFIFNNTRLNDNVIKQNCYNNICNIMLQIFIINDILYEICQFQHCDMKAAQVLMYKNNKKWIACLSDFDKSTCTIKYNDIPYRLILKIFDNARYNYTKNNSNATSNNNNSNATRNNNNKTKNEYDKIIKTISSNRFPSSFVNEKQFNTTQNLYSNIEIDNNLFNFENFKIEQQNKINSLTNCMIIVQNHYSSIVSNNYSNNYSQTGGYLPTPASLGLNQTINRYFNTLFVSNDFYNVCLFSSVAALSYDTKCLIKTYEKLLNDIKSKNNNPIFQNYFDYTNKFNFVSLMKEKAKL